MEDIAMSIISIIFNIGATILAIIGVKNYDDYGFVAALTICFAIVLLFISIKIYGGMSGSRTAWYNVTFWLSLSALIVMVLGYAGGFYKDIWDSPELNTPIGGDNYVSTDSWDGTKPDTWDYNHDGKLDDKEMADYREYMDDAYEYGKNH